MSLSASSSISPYRSVSAARYLFFFSLVFLSPFLSACGGALSSGHTQHTSSNVQNIISFFALNIHITTHTSKPDGRREGTNAKKKRPATRRKESAPKIAATQTTPPRLKRRAGRSWGETLKSQCSSILLGFRYKVTINENFQFFFCLAASERGAITTGPRTGFEVLTGGKGARLGASLDWLLEIKYRKSKNK